MAAGARPPGRHAVVVLLIVLIATIETAAVPPNERMFATFRGPFESAVIVTVARYIAGNKGLSKLCKASTDSHDVPQPAAQ